MPEKVTAQPPLRTQEQVRSRLVLQVMAHLAGTNGDPAAITRAAVRMPYVHPLHWLRAQQPAARIYWADRASPYTVAGLGEADVAFAPAPADRDTLVRQLGPVLATCRQDVRYYGGVRFDQTPTNHAAWRHFGAFWFVLPRFELRADPHGATLYCNLIPARDRKRQAEILGMIAALKAPSAHAPRPLSLPVARRNRPTRSDWHSVVTWALNEFRKGELDKVVLAREATFSFAEPLAPIDLLEQLAASSPHCFHFLFQPQDGPAFAGASPERLFSRKDREVESEAVAGTRPRGSSATDDARLLEELLHSDKERREHEYVRISLREELQEISSMFELDDKPSEMKLAHGRHLVSRVKAILHEGTTSLDVLGALHPTPAVGGYPTLPALHAIRRHEHFDRGWYAGPVGWIGPNAADFAVAIRSGLVDGRQLLLYSGAGIVAGSTPWDEWKEIEHKIEGFTRLFGSTPARLRQELHPAAFAASHP